MWLGGGDGRVYELDTQKSGAVMRPLTITRASLGRQGRNVWWFVRGRQGCYRRRRE